MLGLLIPGVKMGAGGAAAPAAVASSLPTTGAGA
jgi:hypothetical protein